MPEFTPNPAFMYRCLDLAQRGRGRVGNGALVGAVLVRGGRIIAEGFHAAYGEPHAEQALLNALAGKIRPEDILYVNLEPCCHKGKTPPCTNLLIDRGVKNLVFGMLDPDPRVLGKGLKELSESGVEVVGPFERALCESLNKGFIQVRQNGRPYITLKKAVSAGGKIANEDGSPMKITSEEQDAWSHQFLRARHDAILVGIGTIIVDNPQLNSRFDQSKIFSHSVGLNGNNRYQYNSINPYRIILDPDLRIQATARVIRDGEPGKTIICSSSSALSRNRSKAEELESRGVILNELPLAKSGFAWKALWQSLITPRADFPGITSILVEGGPKTWELFRKSGLMDEEITLTGRWS